VVLTLPPFEKILGTPVTAGGVLFVRKSFWILNVAVVSKYRRRTGRAND